MKFKAHTGSSSKQKQRDSVKHYRFDESGNSSSPTPFAKFTKKKEKDLCSQISGTFIKKSKGTSVKLSHSETLRQKFIGAPDNEIDTTLHKKKQKKVKRLKLHSKSKGQKIPVKKIAKLAVHQVLDSENVKIHAYKTHKNNDKWNKKLLHTAVLETDDQVESSGLSNESHGHLMHDTASEKQSKSKRKRELKLKDSNQSKEQKRKLTKCDNEIVKNTQIDVNVHNEKILGNKKSKSKKRKSGLQETVANTVLISSMKKSDTQNIPKGSRQHEELKVTEHAAPNKKKKQKHAFYEGGCGVQFYGANCDTVKSGKNIREVSTGIDDQVKIQDKKRKKKPFSEQTCNLSDAKESSSVLSDYSKNFRLDCRSDENVNQKKKKRKKNLESSFVDRMQESSSEVTRNKAKVKQSNTSNEILEPTSIVEGNDSSNFIGFSKKKCRGFEGREDTPERLGRTVFVGNLPLSANKKVLQMLFQNFGEIESVRFRSAVPTKSSIPKKVALIRKEFHSESNSLNAYVVFKKLEDAKKALTLNKTVIQGHHVRVDQLQKSNVYDNKRSVFVGNMPYNITDESLWEVFGECGNIEAVRVIRNQETGVGKGFGFVLFEEKDSVKNALLLNNTEVNGRNIRVKTVEDGSKLKGKNPEGKQRIGLKIEKKHAQKSGWRFAGQKKTKKKMIKKKKDMQNKKRIASILTPK